MSLPQRAIRHPITTLLVFATLAALGLLALSRIGLELFPDVSYPTAAVFTPYPGVGPFEVESGVSRPIEEAVSSISGVKRVSSTSAEGLSLVLIHFTWGTDMSTVVSEIREKISSIESDLPEGAERSLIVRFNPQVLPSLTFTVSSPLEGLDTRRLTQKRIIPEIERLPGVASAAVSGGRKAAVTVRLDLQALANKQIPVLQVVQAFKGENVSLPGGAVSLKDRYLVLRTIGEFTELQDIEGVLVGYREGVAVRLRDVAQIDMGFLPQEEFVRSAGAQGVLVEVHKSQGANTVEMIRGVKAALRRLSASLPASLDIQIRSDQSVSILESLAGLRDAAWQGGILAVLVLLVFLRSLRSTLIVALAIPVSVVCLLYTSPSPRDS